MKRRREDEEEEKNKEEEGQSKKCIALPITRDTNDDKNLLSLPVEILIAILMTLSCCEYNILNMVSNEMKNIVNMTILSKNNGRYRSKMITTKSSFNKMLVIVLLKALQFDYPSLLDWYNKNKKPEQNQHCTQELVCKYALKSTNDNGIEWLNQNGYKIENCNSFHFPDFLFAAIKGGKSKLQLLMSIVKIHGRCNIFKQTSLSVLSYKCGKTGDESTLEWLKLQLDERQKTIEPLAIVGALKHYHYHLFAWFNMNAIYIDLQCLHKIVVSGMIDQLNWLIDNKMILKSNKGLIINNQGTISNADTPLLLLFYNDMYEAAFYSSNLEMVKWVYKSSGLPICQFIKKVYREFQINVVKWAYNEGIFPCNGWKGCMHCLHDTDICSNAGKMGDLPYLQWLRGVTKCSWDWNTCKLAIVNGHFDLLKWALENGCPSHEYLSLYACSFCRLDVLEWFHIKGYTILQEIYSESLRTGNFEVFEWAIKNKIPSQKINWSIQLVCDISNQYQVKIFDKDVADVNIIWERLIHEKDISERLIREKDISMIDWIIERKCPIPNSAMISVYAVRVGGLPLLQKMINYDAKFNKMTLYEVINIGNLDYLKYLKGITNLYYWDPFKMLYKAARKGHLDIVKYLVHECSELPRVDDNIKESYKACYKSAKGGHWNVFEWLVLENGFKFRIKVSHICAYKGNLDFLKKMYNLSTLLGMKKEEILDDKVCALASRKNHFDVLIWAKEVGCPLDWKTLFYSERSFEHQKTKDPREIENPDQWAESKKNINKWAMENCWDQFCLPDGNDDELDRIWNDPEYFEDSSECSSGYQSDDDYEDCRNYDLF